MKEILVLLFLSSSLSLFSQRAVPKNLKKAVSLLENTESRTLDSLVLNLSDEDIKKASYPWGSNFKTVFEWTKRDTYYPRLRKYLEKRGVSHHQIEVVLIAYKRKLQVGTFDENAIISGYKRIEDRWIKEDLVRFTTDSLRGTYIPIDLDDAISQVDKFWADSVKIEIASMTEKEFSGRVHHGFGRWLRNNWQLWGGSRLSVYFNRLGIDHPDDMSGIILGSYWRFLNGKEIDFVGQLNFYKDYWEKVEIEELERRKEQERLDQIMIQEYKLGDTLEFNYNFDFSSEDQEEMWLDDECIAYGVLMKKDTVDARIYVKVIESCGKKGLVVYDNEDVRTFNVEKGTWEKPRKRKKKYLKRGQSQWFNLDDWEELY